MNNIKVILKGKEEYKSFLYTRNNIYVFPDIQENFSDKSANFTDKKKCDKSFQFVSFLHLDAK